jgi:cell division ATPase FtsA
MRFKLFQKKKLPKDYLTIDIGTEAIKVLIFSYQKSSFTERKINIKGGSIQYFDEPQLSYESSFSFQILKKAISQLLKKLQKKYQLQFDFCVLGLPPSFLKAGVLKEKFIRKDYKKAVVKKEYQEILQAVFHNTKKEISEEFAQKLNLFPQDFHFLNFEILEIKVDGYKVSSLEKIKGKEIEFQILSTFLPKYYLKDIEKIFKQLNLKVVKIFHEAEGLPFLLSKTKLDAICIDVGGKSTQISLFEKGKLQNIAEFQKGGSDFTQNLSQKLNLLFPEARVLKHDYSLSKLSEKNREKIKGFLMKDCQNWFSLLKENLMVFSKEPLPSKILLFGGGCLLPEIREILKKTEWKNLVFFEKPKIKILQLADFPEVEVKNKKFNNAQYIPSLLISLAYAYSENL